MDSSEVFLEIEVRLFGRPLRDLIISLSADTRLKRAWEIIERDYADTDLSLSKVARAAGLFKDHLNVLIRKATGLTIHQLLIRYRLLQAVHLMRIAKCNTLDIALDSGFGTLRSFERNFARLLGATPRDSKLFR